MVKAGLSWSGRERNCVFLNTGGPRFADVSAATGLDFDDDGRAAAVVDWDHDGDLDLWLKNRNEPGMRFARNEQQQYHHFLAVKLRGVKSNRDAIGARLVLHLEGEELPINARLETQVEVKELPAQIRTIHAGDGYLTQSSRWVHFGLGPGQRLPRLVIHWPGGQSETLNDLSVDRWYHIVQGAGRGEVWSPPVAAQRLDPSDQEDIPHAGGPSRTPLAWRVPLGVRYLRYDDYQGNEQTLDGESTTPVLINLWQESCPSCLVELGEFSKRRDELKEAGVQILALNADGLKSDEKADAHAAKQRLGRLGFLWDSGLATAQLVRDLNELQKKVLHKYPGFASPTSFLLDGSRRLAVIYRGPVAVDQLLHDIQRLDEQVEDARDRGLHFKGRWKKMIDHRAD
jgi:peroxiredoxin